MNREDQIHETAIRKLNQAGLSRRGFLHGVGGLGAMLGIGGWNGSASAADAPKDAGGNVIPGFEQDQNDPNVAKGWQPV